MKFAAKTELLMYEEIHMTELKPLSNRDYTISKLGELLDGDIYVFQINEKEAFKNYHLPTIVDYYK